MVAASAIGEGITVVPATVEEKVCMMYICFAELFPGHESTQNSETFRGLLPDCSSQFIDMVTLLLTTSGPDDAVIVADGRSAVIQEKLRALFASTLDVNDYMKIWVVYELETCLWQDVRNPKRKLAWSGENIEILYVELPRKAKGQRKLVPRDSYKLQ